MNGPADPWSQTRSARLSRNLPHSRLAAHPACNPPRPSPPRFAPAHPRHPARSLHSVGPVVQTGRPVPPVPGPLMSSGRPDHLAARFAPARPRPPVRSRGLAVRTTRVRVTRPDTPVPGPDCLEARFAPARSRRPVRSRRSAGPSPEPPVPPDQPRPRLARSCLPVTPL